MSVDSIERIHHIPAVWARHSPADIGLRWQDQHYSYSELALRVQTTAERLAASAAAGSRIGVLAWNCPQFVELIYAVPAAGLVLVPLNTRLAPAEIAWQIQAAGVSVLFADPVLLQPLLDHPDCPACVQVISLDMHFQRWLVEGKSVALPATNVDDPVWILYTSGTTGRPKGAVLSHRSFLGGLASAALGRPVKRSDRYLYPFPLFHVAAHNVMLQHCFGASVVLVRAFDADEVLALCRQREVDTLSLAPTMISRLLEHADYQPSDLAGIRSIGYGASSMPLPLLQKLLRDTDIDLCQSYGMTELSGSVCFLTPDDHRRAAASETELLGSVGRPLPTADVRLVDDQGGAARCGESGEILVRGQQCMQGYWSQPSDSDPALADGWLHTGDVGRFDTQGYLYIVDRKKDMILTGGENVASREVEDALRRHPAVRDCAVIGLPDSTWGEAVCAVLRKPCEASDEQLDAHCRTLLAAYKTPKYWFRRDHLPVNASGKVDKASLRRSLTAANA